jgi:hypothetical protein
MAFVAKYGQHYMHTYSFTTILDSREDVHYQGFPRPLFSVDHDGARTTSP